MRRQQIVIQLVCCLGFFAAFASAAISNDQEMVSEIFRSALTRGQTHQLLRELCERYPHRLSGSPESAAANLWVRKVMEERGLEVWLQEVMVPYWERGDTMKVEVSVDGHTESLSALALGGSVGTPTGGIEASGYRGRLARAGGSSG